MNKWVVKKKKGKNGLGGDDEDENYDDDVRKKEKKKVASDKSQWPVTATRVFVRSISEPGGEKEKRIKKER